jgi:hypothetical protein
MRVEIAGASVFNQSYLPMELYERNPRLMQRISTHITCSFNYATAELVVIDNSRNKGQVKNMRGS